MIRNDPGCYSYSVIKPYCEEIYAYTDGFFDYWKIFFTRN
jgi:hypothetical protein